MRKIKMVVVFLLVLIIISFTISSIDDDKNRFLVKRIAHAGGAINGEFYTNSIDALNTNSKRGFYFFEIDFVFTNDDELICLHDWQSNFKKMFGFETQSKLSLDEFEKCARDNSIYDVCTLDSLIQWLESNPDATIITDIKERNLFALEMISNSVPNYKKRIIPQIYSPENYDTVKEMGFEQIIWTLYRYLGNSQDVLNNVDKFEGDFAVTMPQKLAKTSLPNDLKKLGIPTYVHTINSQEDKDYFLNIQNISEIYTDTLNSSDSS
jgi:glycerophosphoryl diester phosphodiesterase